MNEGLNYGFLYTIDNILLNNVLLSYSNGVLCNGNII